MADRDVLVPAVTFYAVDSFRGLGMSVVSARIGAFGDRPHTARALLMWTSPDDLTRLVQATVERTEPGHHVVWAVSRNTGAPADFAAGERIGFRPVDDAAAVLDADERA